jgi:CelD/BcsL family acetyltransferase involved in cellulose biosynthesis
VDLASSLPHAAPDALARPAGFASGWTDLAAASGSPMQSLAWAEACAAAFGGYELRPVAVGAPQRPLAIAPFVVARKGLPRLELAGVNELYEPTDFLYQDTSALCTLAEAVASLRMPVVLKRLPADSPTCTVLRAALGRGAVVISRSVPGAPFIELDQSWHDPEQRLSSRRRADLRRARRRAGELGHVTFEMSSPPPGRVLPLLEEAFRVEAACWKGDGGTALLHDRRRGEFFHRYATAAASLGILRVTFLRIDGRPAATQIAVESGGRYWLLKIGYDASYSRCSPGTLLIAETIRHAARHGLRSYEFLGRVEPWTTVWTERARECVAFAAYPLGVRSAAAFLSDGARFARKRRT